MKRTLLAILGIIVIVAGAVIVAGSAFAQQQRNRAMTPPSGPQSVVSGTVVSFTAGSGQGMPSLVVRQGGADVTLVLGPFWFLQDAKFAAATGDAVEATVLSCADCPSGLAVVAVKNVTTGSAVTLRSADGLPLWIGNSRGPRNGSGFGRGSGPGSGGPGYGGPGSGTCDGNGPDMTQLATFTGTVKSFTGGAGAGRPTLVLIIDGTERTFLVAPFRVVLDSGIELPEGATFTVSAAPNLNQEWVVVTLKDHATGAELVLRDAQTGLPIGGRRGR